MADTTTDLESIINEAAEKLEARYEEVQKQLVPLRQEETEVAEAIYRIVGSYPASYTGNRAAPVRRSSGGTRTTAPRTDPSEREAKIIEFVSQQPEGTTVTAIAEGIGVSSQTADKSIKAMLADGRLFSQGERRGRKIFVPKA